MDNKQFEKSLKGLKKLDKKIRDDEIKNKSVGCLLLVFILLIFFSLLSKDGWGIINGDYNIILLLIFIIALYFMFLGK